MKKKQGGMILLVSLLFLMMMTTIAVTMVNQNSRSPRTVANTEIKLNTFNDAQATVNQISVSGMNTFLKGVCNAARNPYNPLQPAAGLTQEQQQAHLCGTANTPPSPSIRYQSTSMTAPRTENASGVGKYQVEYYQIEGASNQSGISTTLAMNTFKVMLGDQSNGASSGRNVMVSIPTHLVPSPSP
ncbi:hypothetical protein [Endozoicomonas ascidiicola]|uniref:hypothetical protein n=1 Tax=Endozoicomonas ascidiicola TaxID=1698521 RepID=UPI0008375C36|nr:hypothetical protein [Endozoicomonas ascidiicola]